MSLLPLPQAWSFLSTGDHTKAEELFRAHLALTQDHPDALQGLGLSLSHQGRHAESIDLLRRAAKLLPNDPKPFLLLAHAQETAGQLEHAIRSYETAVRLLPRDSRPIVNLTSLLLRLNRSPEAVTWARRALALDPLDPLAHRHLNEALSRVGTPDEQLAAAKVLAGLPPSVLLDRPTQLRYLAAAHHLAGDDNTALQLLGEALALAPNDSSTQLALSLTCLNLGDYARGFALWRCRLTAANVDALALPAPLAPQWDGTSDLAGKRVFVVSEQGVGDLVQFARYLPELARRAGAPILLGCSPLVVPLFQSHPAVASTHSDKQAPPHDVSILLLDLPFLLGLTSPSDLPPPPYLTAPADRVDHFRKLLKQRVGNKPTVGLCWSGNPRQPVNFRRAFDPKFLAPLVASRKDLAFISLQKTPLPNTAPPKGVLDLTDHLKDFADTAALITALDHLLTTDTSTAHLAGALGKNATILLHHPSPHWTWGPQGDTTPWYPTLKLLRQPVPGDWATLISEAARQLP